MVAVGGLAVAVRGSEAVLDAVRARYGAFLVGEDAPHVTLDVDATPNFRADYDLRESDSGLTLATDGGTRIVVGGSAVGGFDPGRAVGELRGAVHLGQVDALLRLALSLLLPRRGALLLHGTAVPIDAAPRRENRVALLVGASGAGKSTAAAALGARMGDELVVAHVDDAISTSGTPYWRGSPDRASTGLVAILSREGAPSTTPLSGSHAMRALLPHVVRYVGDASTDRAVFALVGALASRLPIVRFGCPEGDRFVPFVKRALAAASVEERP